MSEEEKQLVSQADLEAHKKETHKQLVQSLLLTFTAFLAIAAVCIAWFINNASVSGGGVQMQSAAGPFELATQGTTAGQYPVKDMSIGTAVTYGDKTYMQTDGGNLLVQWMVDETSGFANQADAKTMLQPGSFGSITFYLIPKTDRLGSVRFTISLTPYRVLGTDETAADDILVLAPSTDQQVSAVPVSAQENEHVYALLQGRVLFFETRTGSAATGYHYAGWVNGSFVRDFSKPAQAGKDEPQKITLYWVWPLRFDNYVSTKNGDGNLFSSAADEDFNKLLADMNGAETYKKYFYDPTNRLSGAKVSEIDQMGEEKEAYRGYYNAGDEEVGTKARFIQLIVTATEDVLSG